MIRIARRPRPTLAMPLTSLVDVLLILLIFFMVTSTYLDLDMIPVAEPAEASVALPSPEGAGAGGPPPPLLIRLDPDGIAVIAGTRLETAAAGAEVAGRLAADPSAAIVVLPSPRASVQALVTLLDAVTAAGAARVSVVRLDGP